MRRPRDAPKWATRTMDLDLLLYDDLIRDVPGLKVTARRYYVRLECGARGPLRPGTSRIKSS